MGVHIHDVFVVFVYYEDLDVSGKCRKLHGRKNYIYTYYTRT